MEAGKEKAVPKQTEDKVPFFSRRGLLAGLFSGLVALSGWFLMRKEQQPAGTRNLPVVAEINNKPGQLDARQMTKHVAMLSSRDWEGRRSGSTGERKAAEYIAGLWESWGLKPAGGDGFFFQNYSVPELQAYWNGPRVRLAHVRPNAGKADNILAMLPGQDPQRKEEIVLLSAHYDHLGVYEGKILPGANDNASGVAAMLEIARMMAEGAGKLKRTVVFAAWSGEEAGLLGSRHFMTHPTVPLQNIVAVLNLDTLANGATKEFIYWGPQELAWQKTIDSEAKALGMKLNREEPGGHSSDHQPFVEAGVPAVTLLSSTWLEGNHTSQDTSDKLNMDKLALASQWAYRVIWQLAAQI